MDDGRVRLGYVLLIVAGCYRPPSPACGFVCGTGGADLAGNPVVPFSMQFMTGADDVAPRVEQTVPASFNVDIPTDSTIVVTFTEPVTNVDATTFVVAGGLVTGELATSAGGDAVTGVR
jgi:hypothetical protein